MVILKRQINQILATAQASDTKREGPEDEAWLGAMRFCIPRTFLILATYVLGMVLLFCLILWMKENVLIRKEYDRNGLEKSRPCKQTTAADCVWLRHGRSSSTTRVASTTYFAPRFGDTPFFAPPKNCFESHPYHDHGFYILREAKYL